MEQQNKCLYDEASKNGYADIILIDMKESAIKLDEEERIGLQRLKHEIELGDVECVIVYEISRISRRPKVLYSIRDLLIERGIQLICLKPYMRLLEDGKLSQTASIMFSIFTSLSESEMMLKKERMRRGVAHAKAQGRHAGGQIMYGYKTTKDHRYVIDEAKATVVRRIFNEYKKGKSMRMLTRELQEEGIFAKVQFLTAQQEVYDILHRDCYCGKRVGMPAIISEELFYECEAKRKSNMLKVNHTDNMAMLKGILHDSTTGLLMSSNTAAKMYYNKRKRGGLAVSMHCIEPFVWDIAVQWHRESQTMTYDELERETTRRIQRLYRQKFGLMEKIKEDQRKIDKIEERLIYGKLSEAKATELENALENTIRESNRRIIEITAEIDEVSRRLDNASKGDTSIDYDKLDKKGIYDVVHSVIKEIVLSREGRYGLILNIHGFRELEMKIDSYKKTLVYTLYK